MIIEMSTHQKNNSVMEIILSSKAFRTTDSENRLPIFVIFLMSHFISSLSTASNAFPLLVCDPSLRETMWLLLCNENGPALKMWPTVVLSRAEQRRAVAVWTEMAVWSMEELCRRAVKYCAEWEMKKKDLSKVGESEWMRERVSTDTSSIFGSYIEPKIYKLFISKNCL